jgi:uncharacterized protein VirK/YbjX
MHQSLPLQYDAAFCTGISLSQYSLVRIGLVKAASTREGLCVQHQNIKALEFVHELWYHVLQITEYTVMYSVSCRFFRYCILPIVSLIRLTQCTSHHSCNSLTPLHHGPQEIPFGPRRDMVSTKFVIKLRFEATCKGYNHLLSDFENLGVSDSLSERLPTSLLKHQDEFTPSYSSSIL